MYRDDELRNEIVFDERACVQAAAFTVYQQLLPKNQKQLTYKEFHERFVENWKIFADMEEMPEGR